MAMQAHKEKPVPITIRFYKPYGVLTKFTDPDGRANLKDFIDLPNIYAAGRLDKDSEGLLILTDDNRLKTRLTEPRFEHPRTYWAQVEHIPSEQALSRLRKGVEIKDYRTRPTKVDLMDNEPDVPPRNPPIRERKNIPTAWLEMTLTEGKNRQVRRMTAAVGHPTLRLVRHAIGDITLSGLALGEWQHLSELESEKLYRSVGLKR